MAMELVKLNSETLPAIANAIRAKTGDTALLLPSEMAAAIAGIPTGGSLPALTTPAAEKDVLAGKEYIDGSGAKKTGTLVVCDTVQEAEIIGVPGVGLTVEVESSADGSSKTLTLPEPNLKSENIKSGVSIFGVSGSANALKSASGTFTLSEDTLSPEITHGLGVIPDLIIMETLDYEKTQYTMFGFIALRPGMLENSIFTQTTADVIASIAVFVINSKGNEATATTNASAKMAFINGLTENSFACPYVGAAYKYRAGCTYKWTAFAGLA